MKNKFFLIIIFLVTTELLYASPIAGVAGISGNTERASALAMIIEQHTLEILKKYNFSTIPPEIIKRELTKFNCTEEKCVLTFAENADIDLVITGTVFDLKKSIIIKLEAYGINIPFNKRIINKYEIKIPMNVSINSREFSLISEEHAAEFISRTLDVFLYPVKIQAAEGKYTIPGELNLHGRFKVYSKDKTGSITETGEADISENSISLISGEISAEGGFVLLPFKDKSKEITDYYRNRKREIVFQKTSFYDTLFMLAVIPAASASMPVSSPFLGYYRNNDWQGLGLWMLNAPPYLYMEARGFLNSPENLKDKNKSITRDDRAMNYFAWYMLLSGGMPLFIDSYTADYLHQASYFTGNNDLLGNTSTAAMLSLSSNGAGHFYRGSRYWGYFYFHLNNILLYMTIREFSTPEYYNEISGTYTKGNVNRNRGIALCSLFALSKTVEIFHAIFMEENISSGEIIDEYIIPEPLFTLDGRGNPVYGASITLKF